MVAPERVYPPEAAAATEASPIPVHGRRVVAFAVSPMELLRPESDLARLVEGFRHADLLIAADDLPLSESDDDPDDAAAAEVRDRVADLDLPGLHMHRLGMRTPLGPDVEDDLVAALSELVGFDPEPDLYCLAPVAAPADLGRGAVDRAVRRIAQVYGLPLLRYRCLELSVVGESRS